LFILVLALEWYLNAKNVPKITPVFNAHHNQNNQLISLQIIFIWLLFVANVIHVLIGQFQCIILLQCPWADSGPEKAKQKAIIIKHSVCMGKSPTSALLY